MTSRVLLAPAIMNCNREERVLTLALRIAARGLTLLISLLAALYVGDYGVAKYRISTNRSAALEAVRVQPMYVIPHKDSRAEYVFGEPQMQTCVHAIFPHFGYSPCWYVKNHAQPTVPMTILP